MFENVADSYDLMNDVMSVGTHRLWKNQFVNQLKLQPKMKILDMAGGTGKKCVILYFTEFRVQDILSKTHSPSLTHVFHRLKPLFCHNI